MLTCCVLANRCEMAVLILGRLFWKSTLSGSEWQDHPSINLHSSGIVPVAEPERHSLESPGRLMFARPLVRSAPKTIRAARAAQPLSIVLFEVWPQQL